MENDWKTVGLKDKKKKKNVSIKAAGLKLAVKRLKSDWLELSKHPLRNCSAQPLEQNIMEWHVNFRSEQAPMKNVIFHILLKFKEDYPSSPPAVYLPTGLPHANCLRKGDTWIVCSDLLENGQWAVKEQKTRSYTGWSSAYSLSTLLLQLQTLVMDKSDWKVAHNGITMDQARRAALRYKCPSCSHDLSSYVEPDIEDFHDGEAMVVWPPLCSGKSTTLKEAVNEKQVKFSIPKEQPIVQPVESLYAKLQRLEKTEQVLKGWIALEYGNNVINCRSNGDTLRKLQNSSASNIIDETGEQCSKRWLSKLPRNTKVWARLEARNNSKWYPAVLISSGNGIHLVRFHNHERIIKLPTECLRIPDPVQKKLKVNELGVPLHITKQRAQEMIFQHKEVCEKVRHDLPVKCNKSTQTLKHSTLKSTVSPLRLLPRNSPVWVRLGNKWRHGRLIRVVSKLFLCRVGNIAVKQFPAENVLIPNLLRQKMIGHLQNSVVGGIIPPKSIVLLRKTPVFAQPAKKKFYHGTCMLDKQDGRYVIYFGHLNKTKILTRDSIRIQTHVLDMFIRMLREPIEPIKKKPVKIYSKWKTAVQKVPAVNRSTTGGLCNMKLNGGSIEINQSVLPFQGRKKTYSTTPELSVAHSGTTSEGSLNHYNLTDVDPFHNVKELVEGDEIIVKSGKRGVIKSFGKNVNIFLVRFEGESMNKMVTRSAVQFLKQIGKSRPSKRIKPNSDYFRILRVTELFSVMEFLTYKEIARLACTCKELRDAAEDKFLWRVVFSRQFPKRKVNSNNVANWKYLFMLESEQIFQSLVCYHTKASFNETVLGIPLIYTTNPVKKTIDYIKTWPNSLLCKEAFHVHHIRKTIWKESFTHWLPIYINYDHFRRGLDDLKKTIRVLAQKSNSATWKNRGFNPQMVLDVFPQILKTYKTISIADKGEINSDEILTGYCSIHRLFLALVLEYPTLRHTINQRIARFIKNPSNRTKSECPDLGNFITLITVSDKYYWKDVSRFYLSENLDRSILWSCRKYPELHNLATLSKDGIEIDRIEKMWTTRRINSILALFNSYFASQFCRNRSIYDQVRYYDRFFGRPARADVQQFKKDVDKMINCAETPNNWGEWFRMLGLKALTPQKLTSILRNAVKMSKTKGYTNNKMNFSKIHASGVGQIVLAGQSYSVDPTIQTVEIEDIWIYTDDVNYLDFSAIALNRKGKKVDHVDYLHKSWRKNGRDIMHHSGDEMEDELSQGRHTLQISLNRLPINVERVVFVVTAYRLDFSQFKQTYVRLVSKGKAGSSELCRGAANDLAQKYPKKTLLVIGELKRTRAEYGAQWKFIAHDVVGNGTVRNYEKIIKQIPK